MFKKMLIASAIAFATMSSAMAEWQIENQDENTVLAKDPDLGVVVAVSKLGPSGDAPVDQVAQAMSKQLKCGEVQEMELAGVDGYFFEGCPNNLFVFVADDGKDIGMITGACDTDEKCEAIGRFIGQAMAEGNK